VDGWGVMLGMVSGWLGVLSWCDVYVLSVWH
jgi:hypothetical protein